MEMGCWYVLCFIISSEKRTRDGLGFTVEYQHGSGPGMSHHTLGGGHTLAAVRPGC